MSNYHILEITQNRDLIHVVFHTPVPDILNEVGYNIQDALGEDPKYNDEEGMRRSSRVPWIDTPEQIQLNNGELFEHHINFMTTESVPFSTIRDQLDAMFTELTTTLANKLIVYYSYWRYARDVP